MVDIPLRPPRKVEEEEETTPPTTTTLLTPTDDATTSPATFQRLIEGSLAGPAREKCLIYLDDVLVVGQTFAEHLSNLREVFTTLSAAGLRLKPAKCHLVRPEVSF